MNIRDVSLHEYPGSAGAFKCHACTYTAATDNRNLSIKGVRRRKMNSLMFDINSTTGAPMCAPVKS